MPFLLLLASAMAFGWVLLPFYGAILWAVVIDVVFAPTFRRLLPRLGQRRNAAAGVVVFGVLVIGVIPFALIGAALAREAMGIFERISTGEWRPALYLRGVYDRLPAWLSGLLERVGVDDFDRLQARLSTALAQGSQWMAAQAFGIGLTTFGFLASATVTLYLAFFLVRDGEALAGLVEAVLPLKADQKAELLERFAAVARATVKGGLLVAAIQGTLGGLAFWMLGVRGALLWAVLMGFLSLMPVIGASLVWVPVALYFLLMGLAWKTLVLVTYGVVVHGMVDNFLRPILVGKDARMPDYIVMITTLGGMALVGINGFILGPMVAALFLSIWQMEAQARLRKASA